MRINVCCFLEPDIMTVPYDETSEFATVTKQEITEAVIDMLCIGVDKFIIACGRGINLTVGKIIAGMIENGAPCRLYCVAAHEQQATYYTESQRDDYFKLIEICDGYTEISHRYTPDCFEKRDKFILDLSSHVIAFTDSIDDDRIRYCEMHNKDIKRIRTVQQI